MAETSHLAAALKRDAVLAHLLARTPELLQREDFEAVYAAEVEGIAAEVIDIAGDPELADAASPLRLRALSLGVASSIESSLFPEQQLGDSGRADQLRARFVAVLAQLRGRYPDGPASNPAPTRYYSGYVPL
ncbi:MAG: hypothetical protein EOP01_02985 [Propionibacteriaceae bacterium]|nr:MAG: hypothetical protein EOP01_02985 [Propionibacteriaceae bacterium]